MKDQFDNLVPNDLVVLENEALEYLETNEVEAIDQLDWYQVSNHPYILVSFQAIEKVVELPFFVSEPNELGLELKEVEYINPNLHRYSLADGWYHA